MNKKILLIVRIVLYSVAVYVILDLFVFSTAAEDKSLNVFEKRSDTIYWEFFVKFKREDSTWVVIQTAPIIQSPIELDKREAWTQDFENWDVFKQQKLKFNGFYWKESLLLNRKSFFILVDQIDEIKNNKDPNLNKLNRYHSFTAVFELKK